MDSILEIDKSEIKQIKDVLAQNKEYFVANAPQLLEDCFHLLLSSQAKIDGFHLIKQLTDPNNQGADALN